MRNDGLYFWLTMVACAGLVSCGDPGPAPPDPPPLPELAPVKELREEIKKHADEITPKLSKALALAKEANLGDTPCADTLDAHAREKYDEIAVVVTPALVEFATSPSFGAPTTGFVPPRPPWAETATASVALLGKGGALYNGLEALAFIEPEHGADLMQKRTNNVLDELKKAWSPAPRFAIVLLPVGETKSKVVPGAEVETDVKTGEKSVAIQGGGSGGRVTVVDLEEQKARCAFSVTASDTGGYGSGTDRVSSGLISAMEQKLGKKGLFKPR